MELNVLTNNELKFKIQQLNSFAKIVFIIKFYWLQVAGCLAPFF
jgi:hypothetical protein